MKMPGLHGLEVLTRMVTRRLTPPVIICSAYDQLKDEYVVASYPRLRYLVKPVAAEALEVAVRELLNPAAKQAPTSPPPPPPAPAPPAPAPPPPPAPPPQ
jgi:DNA-binding response OmpR family regulator